MGAYVYDVYLFDFSGDASSISKRSLFEQYESLLKLIDRKLPANTYFQCKAAAVEYQNSKLQFYEGLTEAGFGTWLHNYDEVDMFQRESSDI